MEEAEESFPVTVEGDWTPDQTRTVTNKLELYFNSKRKSGGGDCRVEVEDGAPRAKLSFRTQEVRERVLARKDHEIVLDKKTVKLRLSSAACPTSSNKVTDPSENSKTPSADSKTPESEVKPEDEASEKTDEPVQSLSVVLDNVVEKNMSRDLLQMLVEAVSGLDESHFSLEIIVESDRAVVTFKSPEGVEKFLSGSQTSQKLQRYKLSARQLEAAKSVRVESLSSKVVEDMLSLYFEKNWTLPESITMIPEEEAAIVTFSDPKVVENICLKQDYSIGSTPVKVYPYYESLSTALYGKEQPMWKMPEPIKEQVLSAIWKFLEKKKLFDSINDQMRQFHCSVNMKKPEVELSPVPNFLRQKGLTAQQVDTWSSTALDGFRRLMSQYTVFECSANKAAWTTAEEEVRSVVREDAVLVLDASKGVLTVAGQADVIKKIRAPVEDIVLRAVRRYERQTNGVSEMLDLSPGMHYILHQEGLQKAAQDISLDMILSYDTNTQKLTISGLREEISRMKTWILERNVKMSKKPINVSPCLLEFLKTVDPMSMSQQLFTSHGICAIFTVDPKGVLLIGSSENALTAAENKMKDSLFFQTLDVEDQEVLKHQKWADLNRNLLDSYNSSKGKTVSIQIRDKVTVAGFSTSVKEICRNLSEYISNYSQIQDSLRVASCAVIQFIEKKKSRECSNIEKNNNVKLSFNHLRKQIVIAGARLHVQNAKACFKQLTDSLFSDNLSVNKPGAKKYFQSHGSVFLSNIMSELNCVVMLRPENEEEEEGEKSFEEEDSVSYCKVKTADGVLVSVKKANICSFGVDAVVNAANEDLQHIDGLALALLKAAGQELQKISDDYVSEFGKLHPGDAIVTGACNLPCKYVVHAVGPRFSDSDKKTAVLRLKRAITESLKEAEKVECSSVALPAISSGMFGFPVDLCAETIAQAVREYCDDPLRRGSLTEVHLVDNNDNTVRVLASAVNKEFSDLESTMTIPSQAGGHRPQATGGHQRGRGQGGPQRSSRGHHFGERGGEHQEREGAAAEAGAGFQGGHHGNRAGPSPGGNARHEGMEQTTAEGLKIVLWKGNIQDQTTHVIVNTIGQNMNLKQGAVSNAILQAAGPGLQAAVQAEAGVAILQDGDVVITNCFDLMCQKVFHVVCPGWDNGGGQAEEVLITIVRKCLMEAEKLKMASLSIPAIGTGNLNFPRDVVSRVLLREIHAFSSQQTPQHLREVAIVVHPSDSLTVDCFTSDFKGQTDQRNIQQEVGEFVRSPAGQPPNQPQQSSGTKATFGQVSSPSLGVYQMQMGPLSLEVSSGDITKETCDVIINSSNEKFDLQTGVSKAILDSAGMSVLRECSRIVRTPGYQPGSWIQTSAGQLPCGNIIHVYIQKNDPATIKEIVYSVLKVCEENKFQSVAFPALGTGQGGVNPSAVADAMVEAIVDFLRKKHPKSVSSVKILIFQAAMVTEFHDSMKKREGEEVEVKVEVKSIFTKIKDAVSGSVQSLFGGFSDAPPKRQANLVLEAAAFALTEFQLCADDRSALDQAKRRIEELILAEQAKKTITDQYISQLSQEDMDKVSELQKSLTVRIRLEKGQDDEEPKIHLEGLTRDVFNAESSIRDIIRKVERSEGLKGPAMLVSSLAEWQFLHTDGSMVPFDIFTNLKLEEALKKKESVKIKINSQMYIADVTYRRAVLMTGGKTLELFRKDLKADAALPSHWSDMSGDLLKRIPLTAGSNEYNDVVTELTRTKLTPNIISIERVQNPTLWQGYQGKKKELEKKNKHTNNEKRLFHGTGADAIDLINKHGFNRSYAGKNAAVYGNGAYFAVDPSYSAHSFAPPDANGHKRMYLARVLVGDFTQGGQGMLAPPAKTSGNTSDLYDSVTDNRNPPTMFIVFNDSLAYPEYLITFT